MGKAPLRLLVVSAALHLQSQHHPSHHHQPFLRFLSKTWKINLFLPDLRVPRRVSQPSLIHFLRYQPQSIPLKPFLFLSGQLKTFSVCFLFVTLTVVCLLQSRRFALLFNISLHFFEIYDVISNCLFNIKVKKRILASYKGKEKTRGILGLGDSLNKGMDVGKRGHIHRTSSLTDKPGGKNGLKSQADVIIDSETRKPLRILKTEIG